MLIDASHPEETRVVVLDGNRVEEFDFEAASKRPLKGNIYLAKVTRVEPSLQAAFVEYGGNRQGFLAFSEIHPDYYQVPVADRMALLAAQAERAMADEDEGFDDIEVATAPAKKTMPEEDESLSAQQAEAGVTELQTAETAPSGEGETSDDEDEDDEGEAPESQGESFEADNTVTSIAEEHEDEHVEAAEATAESETGPSEDSAAETEVREGEDGAAGPVAQTEPEAVVRAEATGAPQPHRRRDQRDRPRPPRRRQYKIQEVIKRRQIMLVQVVKEERGNKGASLTTFLSLAGRYCVLMPNTPRGGGISRKITNATDRKRLKAAAQSLELPEGMGLIIRTAGANRTKLEIKRDYEYLLRLWDTVRELTLKSNAPALVYEEGSLIKRAIRDLYNKDTSEIVVDGEAGYRDAKDFMRMLMPSHAKNVKLYKEALPLFQRHQVESQLDAMFSPLVTLRSGGYIVINQTEALVSIDVNSGKATREHSIEETAYKTNLEAADEIARQLRLRDLAGLVVIDFIDMEDAKNDRNVEKRLHNAVRGDRARIQIGKISQFGLLEMSRQRLRAGVVAGSTITCPHCNGQGIIRSTESAALRLLRALDEEGQRAPSANLTVKAPQDVTIYTLNQKRREIDRIEDAYNLGITFEPTATMMGGSFEIDRTGARAPQLRPKTGAISVEAGFQERPEIIEPDVEQAEDEEAAEPAAPSESQTARPSGQPQQQQPGSPDGEGHGGRRRRRRRRRGGRGRSGHHEGQPQHGHQQHRPHEPRPIEAEARSDDPDDAADADDSFEAVAATAPEPGDTQNAPAPQQEGGGRRRRRRRGRRGRRHDGESSNGAQRPQDAHNEFQSAPFERSDYATREERGPHAVEANAPSSPQWSLSEQRTETGVGEREPESSRPAAQESFIPSAVSEPVAVVETEETVEPEPAEPREARKGWWQRRFKM
jgi:ribonuclease E